MWFFIFTVKVDKLFGVILNQSNQTNNLKLQWKWSERSSLSSAPTSFTRLLLVTGEDLRLIQSGPAPLPDPSLFWHPTTAVVITLITKLFQPPPQNPFWLAPPASPSIVILITMSSGGGSEHQLNFWLIRTGDTFPCIIIIRVGRRLFRDYMNYPLFLYI